MKKISYTLIGISLLAFGLVGSSSFALAADDAASTMVSIPTPPVVSTPAPSTENVPNVVNVEKKLSNLVKRGANLINQRLASLGKLKTQINNSKLTDDQKTVLVNNIGGKVSALTDLQNQIKAGTDLNSVRDMVKSIYTDYRIYAVFIPQTNLTKALDLQLNHKLKISDVLTKIQQKLDAAKAAGKDTTVRQASLDQANSLLNDTKTKIDSLLTEAGGMMPADYPATSKTKFTEVRTGVQQVRQNFLKINQFAKMANKNK